MDSEWDWDSMLESSEEDDIYKSGSVEQLLYDDELNWEEAAFMNGYIEEM